MDVLNVRVEAEMFFAAFRVVPCVFTVSLRPFRGSGAGFLVFDVGFLRGSLSPCESDVVRLRVVI